MRQPDNTKSHYAMLFIMAVLILSLSTILFHPVRIATADIGNGQIGGNYNYFNYQTLYTNPPNNNFAWGTAPSVTSGSCNGCFSMQVQLYDDTAGKDLIYQEVLIQTTDGNRGCVYSYCNYFCISDWKSNSGCIAGSEYILNSVDITGHGWSIELECNSSVCSTFWILVYGPNNFYYDTYINDPNEQGVLATQANIVGPSSSAFSTFTAGSGTIGYTGFPYVEQLTAGSGIGFTVEDSNMNYAPLSSIGSNNYQQQFVAGEYYLIMNLPYGGSPSSGWYQIGSHQQISAGPGPCYVYTHPYLHYVHYYFSSWSGSGTGSYSGSNNPASITMNGPITQTANYNYNTNPC